MKIKWNIGFEIEFEFKSCWFEFLIGRANYFEEDPQYKYWFDWDYTQGTMEEMVNKPYRYWDLNIVLFTICFTWAFYKPLTPIKPDDIL